MSKVNIAIGLVSITILIIIIKHMINEWPRKRRTGKLLFESTMRFNVNWINVIIICALLALSINSNLFTHWLYRIIQIMFFTLLVLSVIRGMRKTQIFEDIIISPDFVVRWSEVKGYEWDDHNNKFRYLKIILASSSKALFGIKNKSCKLRIKSSESDLVIEILKKLS